MNILTKFITDTKNLPGGAELPIELESSIRRFSPETKDKKNQGLAHTTQILISQTY